MQPTIISNAASVPAVLQDASSGAVLFSVPPGRVVTLTFPDSESVQVVTSDGGTLGTFSNPSDPSMNWVTVGEGSPEPLYVVQMPSEHLSYAQQWGYFSMGFIFVTFFALLVLARKIFSKLGDSTSPEL